MCGITGFVGRGDQKILEHMVAAVRHRGPDDSGAYFDAGHKIGLGHARLSILDVSQAGHQPMWSEDKTVAIVFNGEIYNFLALRHELETTHGCRFKTGTDTEVIIAAYQIFREACFEKMEGMFAIALYDVPQKRLILVRDRMGKKPLYWGMFDGTLVFGSELKSLVLHPSFKKEIDLESVNKYLQYDYVPTPHTIWKNTYKLEPATYAVFEFVSEPVKKSHSVKFWKPDFTPAPISLEKAKVKLDTLLDQAVKNRLVADVPVGIFLSGGLDSSAIAYYAVKNVLSNHTAGHASKVKTFSIGFSEKSFDESSYARIVSKFLGTVHYEKIFSAKDSLDVIPEVLANLDEPMADASIIPTYLLSKFAREHVTVALGGDGGDELFAGYPTFQADKLSRIYEYLPAFIRRSIVEPVVKALPASSKNFSLGFKMQKFIEGFRVPSAYRHQAWIGSFGERERADLFRPELWGKLKSKNVFEDIDRYYAESGGTKMDATESGSTKSGSTKLAGAETGNRTLYEYMRTYLMDEVLVKVDRASMLASLEARSPLLDRRIVDFAHALPYRFKLHGFTTKYIFKELMKGKLPKGIIHRQKKGFGMPMAEWLRGPLKPMVLDFLGRENIQAMGLFDPDYVERILNEHWSGKKDHRKQIWNLLVFAVWWREYLAD